MKTFEIQTQYESLFTVNKLLETPLYFLLNPFRLSCVNALFQESGNVDDAQTPTKRGNFGATMRLQDGKSQRGGVGVNEKQLDKLGIKGEHSQLEDLDEYIEPKTLTNEDRRIQKTAKSIFKRHGLKHTVFRALILRLMKSKGAPCVVIPARFIQARNRA